MDKKDLIKYIDRINLTGPGGRDKIKKILMDFAVNGSGGGGGGDGGGGDDDDTQLLSKFVYYGERDAEISVNSGTGSVVFNNLSRTHNSVIRNVPCYSKYYYVSIPVGFTLKRVVTENAEDIKNLFTAKGRYSQSGDSYTLYEFHLTSDIPLNVALTITIVE